MRDQVKMWKLSVIFCCIFSVIHGIPLAEDQYETNEALEFTPLIFEDAPTPQELAEQAGYVAETHEVITEDRYVLTVHRITGSRVSPPSKKKPAVLLLHGLLDCSATWVFPGPGKGLAMILADWGYDVWLGNVRGNRYSRKHLDRTVKDPDFWTFSWHEMGLYDIPAMIDHILHETKQEKIFYVGHSQGGTAFFVMASERPEYQKKITAAFTLAPAVLMSQTRNIFVRLLAPHATNLKALADLIGLHEFRPTGKIIQTVAKEVCKNGGILQPICKNVIFLIGGIGDKELNTTLIPSIAQYEPAGASTRQFAHYAQLVNSGKFQQYDHGAIGNKRKYGKLRPPEYKLANIKIPVYLHYSSNDAMVAVENIHQLYKILPNAEKFLVPFQWFTHLDFVWGRHVDVWVYNKILSLMERHRN